MKARALSAKILKDVLSLESMWEPHTIDKHEQAPLIKFYCFNVLRHYYFLEEIVNRLVKKPLKEKDFDIKATLLIGLLEIWQDSNKEHAIVNESVNTCKELKKEWAKGMINASLRKFIREKQNILLPIKSQQATFNHPKWLIKVLKAQYPDHWESILQANQQHPPMTLRVNAQKISRDEYAEQLQLKEMAFSLPESLPQAVCLTAPTDVLKLPGFEKGQVSLQDLSAQYAAHFLDAQNGMRVLDACAAPGGKTAHVLERTPDLKMHAIEISPKRAQRLRETLTRLGLSATIIENDASTPSLWWDGKLYDRILLDAPCTGSGVIKRHPDIKFRLDNESIEESAALQSALLEALWPLVAPNGVLLYATCSIFKQENSEQISTFLENHPDAQLSPCECPSSFSQDRGYQILPDGKHDGFYYAKLVKISPENQH